MIHRQNLINVATKVERQGKKLEDVSWNAVIASSGRFDVLPSSNLRFDATQFCVIELVQPKASHSSWTMTASVVEVLINLNKKH